MSVVPVKVPARRRSVFDEDFDVMSGYRLSYSGAFPTVRFAATVWDFTSVPDIPKGLARAYLVIDWNRVDSRWRLLVKELLAAMLCPLHPAVVALPQRRQWPLPFISLRMTVSQVSHWLEWLDGEGIGSLDAVTQQSCDGYLLQFEHQSPGYRMNRVIAVGWLRHYAPVLLRGLPRRIHAVGPAQQLRGRRLHDGREQDAADPRSGTARHAHGGAVPSRPSLPRMWSPPQRRPVRCPGRRVPRSPWSGSTRAWPNSLETTSRGASRCRAPPTRVRTRSARSTSSAGSPRRCQAGVARRDQTRDAQRATGGHGPCRYRSRRAAGHAVDRRHADRAADVDRSL